MSRQGDWLQTFTGIQFWPLDPRPEEVSLYDIAHALAMSCRYNGHCSRFYSIAEHSVLISKSVSPENALAGLLHDAAEAYLGDMARPLKRFVPDYGIAEKRVEEAIFTRFGLEGVPAEVHEADWRILVDERDQLMGTPPAPWSVPEEGLGVRINCWSPEQARAEFLVRFSELTGGLS